MTYEEKQAHYLAVWEAGGRTVIEPRPLRAVKLCRLICPSCGAVFYGEEADPRTHRHRCQDHKQRRNSNAYPRSPRRQSRSTARMETPEP